MRARKTLVTTPTTAAPTAGTANILTPRVLNLRGWMHRLWHGTVRSCIQIRICSTFTPLVGELQFNSVRWCEYLASTQRRGRGLLLPCRLLPFFHLFDGIWRYLYRRSRTALGELAKRDYRWCKERSVCRKPATCASHLPLLPYSACAAVGAS